MFNVHLLEQLLSIILNTALLLVMATGKVQLSRTQRGIVANVAASTSKTQPVPISPFIESNRVMSKSVYTEYAPIVHNQFTDREMYTAEEKLVEKLLNKGSLTVRPNGYLNLSTNPVHVEITYNVVQILGFSQAEETLSISGWFTLKWKDPRLIWDPNDFSDIQEVSLPSMNIWIPDVGVMNGRSSTDFDFSANVRGRVTVDSEGSIIWLHGAVLDVTCPLDVSFFPFDYQTCFLILTPWQSGERQLLLEPRIHGSAVDNSYLPNSNVSEWEIQSVHFARKKYRSDLNITYQYVSIAIHLKRQPLYFVVLVLVPFSMLSALACLIFTLDDTGDRLSVALSLVLSMTMYVVIVSTNAPRSMRTLPVLGIFLLDQLGLLSIATILAVVNNKLYHSTELLTWQDIIYAISGDGHKTCSPADPISKENELKHIQPNRYSREQNKYLKEEKHPHENYVDFLVTNKNYVDQKVRNCEQMLLKHNVLFKNPSVFDSESEISPTSTNDMTQNERSKSNSQKQDSKTRIYDHHYKAKIDSHFKTNRSCNKSPWIERTLPPTGETSIDHYMSNSEAESTFDSSDDDHLQEPFKIFHTTVTAATAAALAATNILMSEYSYNDPRNSTKVNQTNSVNKATYKNASSNRQVVSQIAAQTAINAAFEAAFNMHNFGKTSCYKCKPPKNSKLHQSRFDKKKNCRTYADSKREADICKMYPYRKLASRLDCVQMMSYLFLSTINAVVCLIIMPRYTQDSNPPLHLIT